MQPSSLPQPQLYRVIEAVRAGQPTAIFEDPFPAFFQGVVGTTMEKRGPMGQSTGEKGDIQQLWSLLGVKMVALGRNNPLGPATSTAAVIWQRWNPYPKLAGILRLSEFVFHRQQGAGGHDPYQRRRSDPRRACKSFGFPFPGAIHQAEHVQN